MNLFPFAICRSQNALWLRTKIVKQKQIYSFICHVSTLQAVLVLWNIGIKGVACFIIHNTPPKQTVLKAP